MCAGGAMMVTCAWVAVNVLRRVVGCELPIELWHLGPRELSGYEAGLFKPLGVNIVDALQVRNGAPPRVLGGWELKAYALVHSRFEQALLLDADNVVVIDPAFLFELPQFRETGAIAWPDLDWLDEKHPIWKRCGVAPRYEPAWETGQLVVDKRCCWHALQIALHMNMHSDAFYPYTHGDKDAFHLAWILAGNRWAMPEHAAKWTRTGICQRDFSGRLIFQHRTSAKWRLLGENVLADHFRHQDECLAFIEELRQSWGGRIAPLPPGSAEDDRLEAELAELRWFRLERPAAERVLIELLPENRIGVGSSRESRLRWYVRDEQLFLDGATEELPPLSRQDDRTVFESSVDGRLALHAVPHAGEDALGLVATQVLERFVDDRLISEPEAVETLAALSKVGDVADALQRARTRWKENDDAQRALERVRARIGARD